MNESNQLIRKKLWPRGKNLGNSLTQEHIVIMAAAALFVAFSMLSHDFFASGNLVGMMRNVAVLGVLSIGMSGVVIGRGVDLAMVATMVVSSAYFLALYNNGITPILAAGAGLLFATIVGLLQGVLVAYAEVPALFTTLAGGVTVYGFGQLFLVRVDVSYLPASATLFKTLGTMNIVGIPLLIWVMLAFAVLFHGFLRYTKYGRFVYASGDNPATARLSGISVRLLYVGQYILSSVVAFFAGLMTIASVSSMSTRVAASNLIYDVILVVVIGGISLSGGKGGIRNVLAGTVLIGILINGMTLMNVPYTQQNIIKGVILLLAIVADTYLNPRDEQTEQQGDI